MRNALDRMAETDKIKAGVDGPCSVPLQATTEMNIKNNGSRIHDIM
jgi:hypothetical protein